MTLASAALTLSLLGEEQTVRAEKPKNSIRQLDGLRSQLLLLTQEEASLVELRSAYDTFVSRGEELVSLRFSFSKERKASARASSLSWLSLSTWVDDGVMEEEALQASHKGSSIDEDLLSGIARVRREGSRVGDAEGASQTVCEYQQWEKLLHVAVRAFAQAADGLERQLGAVPPLQGSAGFVKEAVSALRLQVFLATLMHLKLRLEAAKKPREGLAASSAFQPLFFVKPFALSEETGSDGRVVAVKAEVSNLSSVRFHDRLEKLLKWEMGPQLGFDLNKMHDKTCTTSPTMRRIEGLLEDVCVLLNARWHGTLESARVVCSAYADALNSVTDALAYKRTALREAQNSFFGSLIRPYAPRLSSEAALGNATVAIEMSGLQEHAIALLSRDVERLQAEAARKSNAGPVPELSVPSGAIELLFAETPSGSGETSAAAALAEQFRVFQQQQHSATPAAARFRKVNAERAVERLIENLKAGGKTDSSAKSPVANSPPFPASSPPVEATPPAAASSLNSKRANSSGNGNASGPTAKTPPIASAAPAAANATAPLAQPKAKTPPAQRLSKSASSPPRSPVAGAKGKPSAPEEANASSSSSPPPPPLQKPAALAVAPAPEKEPQQEESKEAKQKAPVLPPQPSARASPTLPSTEAAGRASPPAAAPPQELTPPPPPAAAAAVAAPKGSDTANTTGEEERKPQPQPQPQKRPQEQPPPRQQEQPGNLPTEPFTFPGVAQEPEVDASPPTPPPSQAALLQRRYPFLRDQHVPGVFVEDLSLEGDARFRSAIHRLELRRNSLRSRDTPGMRSSHGQEMDLKAKEDAVNGVVQSIAEELRTATFEAKRRLPFLGFRVDGVLLGRLAPLLDEDNLYLSLLDVRSQVMRGATGAADGNRHRLAGVERCLCDEAVRIAREAAPHDALVDPERIKQSTAALEAAFAEATEKERLRAGDKGEEASVPSPPAPLPTAGEAEFSKQRGEPSAPDSTQTSTAAAESAYFASQYGTHRSSKDASCEDEDGRRVKSPFLYPIATSTQWRRGSLVSKANDGDAPSHVKPSSATTASATAPPPPSSASAVAAVAAAAGGSGGLQRRLSELPLRDSTRPADVRAKPPERRLVAPPSSASWKSSTFSGTGATKTERHRSERATSSQLPVLAASGPPPRPHEDRRQEEARNHNTRSHAQSQTFLNASDNSSSSSDSSHHHHHHHHQQQRQQQQQQLLQRVSIPLAFSSPTTGSPPSTRRVVPAKQKTKPSAAAAAFAAVVNHNPFFSTAATAAAAKSGKGQPPASAPSTALAVDNGSDSEQDAGRTVCAAGRSSSSSSTAAKTATLPRQQQGPSTGSPLSFRQEFLRNTGGNLSRGSPVSDTNLSPTDAFSFPNAAAAAATTTTTTGQKGKAGSPTTRDLSPTVAAKVTTTALFSQTMPAKFTTPHTTATPLTEDPSLTITTPINSGVFSPLQVAGRTSGFAVAAATGQQPGTSLRKRPVLAFKPEESLSSVYLAACEALGMRPNSALIRTFPTVPGVPLPKVDLSVNYVGVKGLLPVLYVLEANGGHLEYLSLCNNNLENMEVLELLDVLFGSAGDGLLHLDLSYNPISQTGGQALLRFVAARPHLVSIKLKGTLVPPKLAQIIKDKVEDNAYRKHIGLS